MDFSDETLQAYFDGQLDDLAARDVADALEASPDLRHRAEILSNTLGDCSWLFSSVSAADAERLLKQESNGARHTSVQLDSRWRRFASSTMLRAAAVVFVAGSSIALWAALSKQTTGNVLDVRRLAVNLPGATRLGSHISTVGGQPVRYERFALASGSPIELDLMAGPRDRALRGGAADTVAPLQHNLTSDSTNEGSVVTFTDPSGFVIRARGHIPLAELKALASTITLSPVRRY